MDRLPGMTDQIAELVDRALERRIDLSGELGAQNDSWRLIHGSADGLDGLTVDKLGRAILIERHQRGAPAEQLIVELVRRYGDVNPIYLKERWSGDSAALAGRQVGGPFSSGDEVVVREQGLNFAVQLTSGEHVGLFLDSRRARQSVRALSSGRRVLNLFSYTAAFGVAAAAGGARSTTNVDIKRSALAVGRRNYELNRLAVDSRTFLRDDAIRFLARSAKGAARFDLVVLDPPPRFNRSRNRVYDARVNYGSLAGRCFKVLEHDGVLLAGSNALNSEGAKLERVLLETARSTGERVEVLGCIGPGTDFPPAPERPVGWFVLVRVSRR